MINKSSLVLGAISLSILSSVTFAAENYKDDYKAEVVTPAPCVPILFLRDGFYFGAGVGYDSFKVRHSATLVNSDGDIFSLNPSLAAQGWDGNVFLGYGQYFGQFYFAGEIFGNVSNAKQSYTLNAEGAAYNVNVSIRESYGASILPGIKLSDTSLIYGRVGAIRTSMNINENGFAPVGSFNSTNNNWVNGLQFGLGVETAFLPLLSVRAEYNYISYSEIKSFSSYTPANSQFILALNYHFA